MTQILFGIFAFFILTMFDYNKLKMLHPLFNGLFAVGVLLLIYSTYRILSGDSVLFSFTGFPILWFVSILGLMEMLYALFFALPFNKTYVKTAKQSQIISSGLYGLCRHPGVWGFFIFYFFAALATGNGTLLMAAGVWTLMDILHVWIQDSLFFVKTLEGYSAYKTTTPFLFFGTKEIRRAIHDLRKENA